MTKRRVNMASLIDNRPCVCSLFDIYGDGLDGLSSDWLSLLQREMATYIAASLAPDKDRRPNPVLLPGDADFCRQMKVLAPALLSQFLALRKLRLIEVMVLSAFMSNLLVLRMQSNGGDNGEW